MKKEWANSQPSNVPTFELKTKQKKGSYLSTKTNNPNLILTVEKH